jgi:O-antigen ligase
MLGLFVTFGLALAVATEKLPVVAISASSPLFAWILLETCASATVRPHARWLMLAATLWLALLCSLMVNLIWGELGAVGTQELALLVRYGFWLVVFVVTAAVVADAPWSPRLLDWLAVATAGLALVRLADAVYPGRAWLHQNEYGLRFSVFTPFILSACLAKGGWLRTAGLTAALAALLVNGSRSSWVAVAVAAAALLGLHVIAGVRSRGLVLAFGIAPAVLAAALWLGPPSWTARAWQRWESFSRLSSDKPFQMRLALIEKGANLFKSKPVFGAGIGRFNLERVELASNRTPWATDDVFNSRSSHNAYLGLLAETGLAGVLPFAALLGLLLAGGAASAYRLARRGEPWAAGAWASALAVSVHLWTLSGLSGTLPWFVFGLTAGVMERDRRRRWA